MIILLAAGASRRMGRQKALLTGQQDSLLSEALAAMEGLGGGIVVVSPAIMGAFAAPRCIEVLVNPEPASGQLRSLQIALGFCAGRPLLGAFICLVDNPGLLSERLEFLAAQVEENRAIIRTLSYKGLPGHPVWIPAEHFAGLFAWGGPDGARGYFATVPGAPVLVEFPDDAALADLDEPADYAAWRLRTFGGASAPPDDNLDRRKVRD